MLPRFIATALVVELLLPAASSAEVRRGPAVRPPVAVRAPAKRKPSSTPDEERINDDVKTRVSDGWSFAPVIGYDPTYKFLLGGAAFHGDNEIPGGSNGSLILYASTRDAFAAELKFTKWAAERTFWDVDLGINNFFTAYFGEGSATTPSAEKRLDNFKANVTPGFWYRFDRRHTAGLYTELRYRRETAVDGNTTARLFPEEFTPVLGASFIFDSRDHTVDTHQGHYIQIKADIGPAPLSSRPGSTTFGRLEAEWRSFTQATSFLVLATQLAAGVSLGDPGFLFRYALGGPTRLRGYSVNRLRGKEYYMLQGEARVSLARWFSIVGFTGIGDTANQRFADFGTPKLTGGVGIRLGLPPDFVAKARLDFAFSRDQSGFYLNFNEVF